jgi:hypothetical protein
LGAVQRTLGVSECGNICFGHVFVAVRQGQRRDTVATGEHRFGICTAGQIKCILLHLYSGDAGGAAGGKARSTEAQTNNRE